MIEAIALATLLAAPTKQTIIEMRQRAAVVIHCNRPDPVLAEWIRIESQRRAILTGEFAAINDHAVAIADALGRAAQAEKADCGRI